MLKAIFLIAAVAALFKLVSSAESIKAALKDVCANKTCPQGCALDNVTRTPSCFCFDGYTPSNRDKENCDDIDECQIFGSCSQTCANLNGSFACSCINGFRLSKDNSSCELVEKNPILIYAYKSGMRAYDMTPNDEKHFSIVKDSGEPVSVTFDARNNWIYWTDVMDQEEAIWRSRPNGTEISQIINTGLILPEGIAFDWIARNIYFTDSNKSQIVVCTTSGGNCTVLIQEKMDKPRDLALHPNLGLLFWTDWGIAPSIIKAGMDGSTAITIVDDNLKWPNGISIDYGNSRLYWTDANTDKIESATLDGEDRRVVKSRGVSHPFGVDVLGDMVYWSDWNLHIIQKSNKFDGSGHETIVKEPFEQLNGLALFHTANQPITRRNHCEGFGCSHICVLSKTSARCLCPVGMYLDRKNKRSCTVNQAWPHFIISYNNTVKIAPMYAIGGKVFQDHVIPQLTSIGAVATIPFNSSIFLSDLEMRKIYSYDLKTSKLRVILDVDIGQVKGMSYDEIGNNLYWVDSEMKTIEVLSLRTGARAVLFREIDEPVDIVVDPGLRMIFLAEKSGHGRGHITRMAMNGFNRVRYRNTNSEPLALTYSKSTNRLYWTDKATESIRSISVDGKFSYTAVTRAGLPYGVASFANKIFWTDRLSQRLKGKQLDTFVNEKGIYIGSYGNPGEVHNHTFTHSPGVNSKITIMNNLPTYEEDFMFRHDCSRPNNQCSHICLLSSEELKGTCVCPENLKLDVDNLTCVPLQSGESSSLAVCVGGKCRVKKKSKSKSSSEKGSSEGSTSTSTSTSTEDPDISSTFQMFPTDEVFPPLNVDQDEEKKKKKKKKPSSSFVEKDSSKKEFFEYDEYDGSPFVKAVTSNEDLADVQVGPRNEDKIVMSGEDGVHPLGVVLAVLLVLIIIGVIIGVILHKRNVHPKVLVRPYVQHWVRYVNQPVQRFFENRGEQLDGKKSNIYDEVYHNPGAADSTYSSAYENIDSITDLQHDSSVNVYEEPGDHRISYNQKDRLIE